MITPGYEYAPVTPMSIYDDRMMLATVAAAKDMYDKAEKKLDDFYEKYSDFDSPIPGANEAWDQATMGYMEKQLNDIETQYGDPLKSTEGRAALQRAIRNAPIKIMNKLKNDTKNYEKWQKSVDDLKTNGLYNQDFINWQLEKNGMSEYDPNNPNTSWTLTSALPFRDMNEYTSHIIDNYKPTDLGDIMYGPDRKPILDKNGNPVHMPGLKSTGITDQQLDEAWKATKQMLYTTDNGQYLLKRASDRLKAAYGDPTYEPSAEEINNEVKREWMSAHNERLAINSEKDDVFFAKEALAMQNAQLAETKAYHDNMGRIAAIKALSSMNNPRSGKTGGANGRSGASKEISEFSHYIKTSDDGITNMIGLLKGKSGFEVRTNSDGVDVAYIPQKKENALDKDGKLKPGYVYLTGINKPGFDPNKKYIYREATEKEMQDEIMRRVYNYKHTGYSTDENGNRIVVDKKLSFRERITNCINALSVKDDPATLSYIFNATEKDKDGRSLPVTADTKYNVNESGIKPYLHSEFEAFGKVNGKTVKNDIDDVDYVKSTNHTVELIGNDYKRRKYIVVNGFDSKDEYVGRYLVQIGQQYKNGIGQWLSDGAWDTFMSKADYSVSTGYGKLSIDNLIRQQNENSEQNAKSTEDEDFINIISAD